MRTILRMAKGTGTNFTDVKHSWFKSKSGLPASAHITDHERAFYMSVVNLPKESTSELEKRWLRTLTGVTSKELADMWREAVVGAGLTPEPSINANREKYYRNTA